MDREFDAVIIGMGPAGMAAAIEMAEQGVNTSVIDESPEAGGQIYRRFSTGLEISDTNFLGPKHKNGAKLIKRFNSLRHKITVLSDTYVWGFFGANTLSLVKQGEICLVTFNKLLLTEGAMERSIPFPGWTLPGIMTLGGLQRTVIHERLLPGRRFLLAGCSPLLLPVAAALTAAGAEIIALCDTITLKDYLRLIPHLIRQKDLAHEAAAYFLPLLKSSIPSFRPYAVVAAHGEQRVEEMTVAKLDKEWKPVPDSEKKFSIDIGAVSYGFVPSARLARLCGCAHVYDPVQSYWIPKTDDYMRTSIDNIYVAGDSAGIGGADLAEVEGRIAANHIALELGRLSFKNLEKRLEALYKVRNRIRGYSAAINKIFSPKTGLYSIMDGKTIVCRCEQVTREEIQKGISEFGCRNINEVKRTRVGMGLCQGRTCESVVTHLLTQHDVPIEEVAYLGLRPPLSPIPFSTFENWAEPRPDFKCLKI